MSTIFEQEFAKLSDECRKLIRTGHIDQYSLGLKQMAKLLADHGRSIDAFKFLISAFYIDLSGLGRAPYIDKMLSAILQELLIECKLTKEQITELYFDLIYPDMVSKHPMSVQESFYLFQLCMDNKTEQAEYVLSRI